VGDFSKASPTSEPKEVADRTLWEEATDADVTLEEAATAVAFVRNC
jgi:hypothetical protein